MFYSYRTGKFYLPARCQFYWRGLFQAGVHPLQVEQPRNSLKCEACPPHACLRERGSNPSTDHRRSVLRPRERSWQELERQQQNRVHGRGENHVCPPLYPELSDEDVDYVCDVMPWPGFCELQRLDCLWPMLIDNMAKERFPARCARRQRATAEEAKDTLAMSAAC